MILLDAYALLAYLLNEPAADHVMSILRGGECSISSVNLTEVLDQLQRLHGLPAGEIAEVVSALLTEVIVVRSVGEVEAWRAADVRARHYRRKDAELSLADCILLASATEGESIATSDPVLAAAARSESVSVIALPDSHGQKP
ncbi:MAG: PIN domain-containing protein [Actinomycetota bacterium]